MFDDKHWAEIGGRIDKALKAKDRNQAWLARELGQTTASANKIVKRGTNSVETLARIALLLQVSMDDLVFGSMTKLPRAEKKFMEDLRKLMNTLPTEK